MLNCRVFSKLQKGSELLTTSIEGNKVFDSHIEAYQNNEA